MNEPEQTQVRLVCAECGAISEGDTTGWRAYLDTDGGGVAFTHTSCLLA